MAATLSPPDLKVLYSQEQVEERIRELADDINQCYAGTSRLVVICILKGAFMFLSDLVKHLTIPCQIEFVRLSSYENAQQSSGVVKPVDLTLPRLQDKDILLIEDIVDTGLTLNFLIDYLNNIHTPRSIKLAVLLDKRESRQKPVPTDFVGFTIPNHFVVGYGLDDQGFYRNLPYIGYFES